MTLIDGLLRGDRFLAAAPPPSSRGGVAPRGNDASFGTLSTDRVRAEVALRVVTLYSCVNLISQSIAGLPRVIVERGDRFRRPIDDPAFWHITRQPNPVTTQASTFWRTKVAAQLLWGNSFTWKDFDPTRPSAAGMPNELWTIRPERVDVAFSRSQGKLFRLDGNDDRIYGQDRIMHGQALSTDGVVGLSPIAEAAQSIGAMISADRAVDAFWRHGMTMSGVLQIKTPADEAKAQALKDRWREKVRSGVAGIGEIAVLDNGAEYKGVSPPLREMQFIEFREFQRDDLISLYRCPPHMLGIGGKDSNWGTGVEQRAIQFVTWTLLPWITALEEIIEAELLPPDLQLKFNVAGLLRGDIATRGEFYAKMRDIGVLSANDVLELEDLPPRPIQDDYQVKSGNVRLGIPNTGPPPETDTPPPAAPAMPPQLQEPAPGAAEVALADAIAAALDFTGDPFQYDDEAVTASAFAPESLARATIDEGRCPDCGRLLGRYLRPESEIQCARCRKVVQPVG